ncbi:hypothetical protein F4561_005497 [Lipingzhangella halophila]|uniref:Uncharacterized protein n=1 Tax=Lipingzhangella halophila TaxID=1783352 RepID=A0A7W7W4Y9_9ACTN|nr:hypothetical protein [Lipingzhangella halophila]MBB4934677.1 hypothetical protein [Lipingzhangella halophila]
MGSSDGGLRSRDPMLHELSSAPLVTWGNAWLAGRAGLDDAVSAVERRTGPHVIGTVADSGLHFESGAPLRSALARLRSLGLAAFRLSLPAPGDPLGLVGTAELNKAAIDAGEAVLVELADQQVGLVPSEDLRGSSYAGVAWTPYRAADKIPEPVPLAEAEQQLTIAMRECTSLFGQVDDIAAWGPEVTRALEDLRDAGRQPTEGLAPAHPQRAHRLAAQADRLAVVVRLACKDKGRGLSTSQMSARVEALRILDRAVRRARVASYGATADG